MRRILTLLLSVALLVLTVGCGAGDDIASSNSTPSVGSQDQTASAENNSKNESEPSSDEVSTDSTSSEEGTQVDDWRTHPEDFKLIALTYDDAPSYSGVENNPTVRIIDTISNYDGRATLFVVGRTMERNGISLLQYAVNKDFELGNHTYSHTSVSTSEVGKNWSALENYEDFNRCQELVKTQLGVEMKYLRPAGVHTNEALYDAASTLGLPCVSGNCKRAVSDYSSETSADMIVERVLANAFDGAIILLHGNNDRTADATERLCELLCNDGYRFCTVDELFRLKGVDYSTLPANAMLYGVDPATGEVITSNKY